MSAIPLIRRHNVFGEKIQKVYTLCWFIQSCVYGISISNLDNSQITGVITDVITGVIMRKLGRYNSHGSQWYNMVV